MWRVHCTGLQSQPEKVELRIPYQEGLRLQKELLETNDERVFLATIGGARLSDRYLLLLNSLQRVPLDEDSGFWHGAHWKSEVNVKAIEVAESKRSGLLILHSHGYQNPPRLSSVDTKSGTSLSVAFRTALPNFPHATAVFGNDGSVSGLVWILGQSDPLWINIVRWISDPVRILPKNEDRKYVPQEMHNRQTVLTGRLGQQLLEKSKVGVIGLGGGGSHVVQQLALLGVRTIVAVDHDAIAESNRSRLIGCKPEDVEKKILKVEIMKRLVQESNPSITFKGIAEKFPSETSVRELKECDILVGCLDTYESRKELQKFAWRYLIPYVDIGLTIQFENSALKHAPRRISGQVYDLIPGSACLWCAQYLTDERISRESGGLGPTYIQGQQGPAQVVSFNGVLASQAVSEVLHLITGYSERQRIPNALHFDGINGTVSPVVLESKRNCRNCENELGRGDPVW